MAEPAELTPAETPGAPSAPSAPSGATAATVESDRAAGAIPKTRSRDFGRRQPWRWTSATAGW